MAGCLPSFFVAFLWLNFPCRANGQRIIPSGQDSSILPSRVANHGAGFDSSCQLTELAK